MGDVGYFDDERNLWLLDRAKDMIVTGGENVYSIEVEEVLARHPAVVECAVFGIPDEQWVEAVHAVVVVASPGEVSDALAEELRDHCRTVDRRLQGAQADRAADRPAPQVRARARSRSASSATRTGSPRPR